MKSRTMGIGAHLLLIAVVFILGATASGSRPNVLLITADDLGLQLGCYGDPTATTPHLDRLAQSGVMFRTAYVSQASCSPSRSTMFTGLYPHANGQYGLANADARFRVHPHLLDQLLPNIMKRSGYRTGIIGKLHVNPTDAFAFDMRNGAGFGSRDVRLQVAQARKFMSGSDPWFLMFNLFDPHVARDRLPNGSRGPQYFPDQVMGLPQKTLTPAEVPAWPWQQIDDREQRTKIAGYYNCVNRIDAAIGMLVEALGETGHEDDTLIIFLGDHGPPFARGKTSCYESGLRIPFLVSWPGVSEPHISDQLVSSADIYPTILDAAMVAAPNGLHGSSLRPVVRLNADAEWRKTLVGEFHYHGLSTYFPRRAITDGRYKLIHNLRAADLTALATIDGDNAYSKAGSLPSNHPGRLAMERLANPSTWELYDLKTDPTEFQNRSGDPAFENIESQLKRGLAAWQAETDDPFRDTAFATAIEAKFRQPN